MGPALGFWSALVATVVALVVALVSGLRGGRRLHLVAGPAAMALLIVAIVLTEELMRGYTFPPAALAFHLVFAKAAGLLALPVLVTGIWLWRAPTARRWHRWAVWIFLVATLVATATGFWMFGQGTPK